MAKQSSTQHYTSVLHHFQRHPPPTPSAAISLGKSSSARSWSYSQNTKPFSNIDTLPLLRVHCEPSSNYVHRGAHLLQPRNLRRIAPMHDLVTADAKLTNSPSCTESTQTTYTSSLPPCIPAPRSRVHLHIKFKTVIILQFVGNRNRL